MSIAAGSDSMAQPSGLSPYNPSIQGVIRREPLNGLEKYRVSTVDPALRFHWVPSIPHVRRQALALAEDGPAAHRGEWVDFRKPAFANPRGKSRLTPANVLSLLRVTPSIGPARPSRPENGSPEVSKMGRVTNYEYPEERQYLPGRSAFNGEIRDLSTPGRR